MDVNESQMPERDVTRVERERWLRRQAMQIVVQLPEDEGDAKRVLDYARSLLQPT